jgi:hypothetical protein
VAESDASQESCSDESSQRGYVLGLFTPVAWDGEKSLSLDFAKSVEPQVVLTNVCLELPDWEGQVHDDVYRAECPCDCACA